MSSEEKSAWIMGVLAVGTYGVYLAVIGVRAGDTPFAEASYVSTLLWTIGASIVASVVLHALFAVHSGPKDQRDQELYRRGEYAGHWVLVAGALVALGLALGEVDQFWIANVVYLAFVLSAVLSAVVRIVGYRRGLSSW